MKRPLAAALAFDTQSLDDPLATTPATAFVRGRDGLLRALDIARLAWPEEGATAGVDYMADLAIRGPLSRC